MSKLVLITILLLTVSDIYGQRMENGKSYILGEGFTVTVQHFKEQQFAFLSYPEHCFQAEIENMICTKWIIKRIFRNYTDESVINLTTGLVTKQYGTHYEFKLDDNFKLIIIPLFKNSTRSEIVGSVITTVKY